MDSRHMNPTELREAKNQRSEIVSIDATSSFPQRQNLSPDDLSKAPHEDWGYPMPASPSSLWFREQFDLLYKEVIEFVNTAFCQADIDTIESSTSPWIKGMPRELLNYTTLVAEADESPDSWDLMLLDRKKRGHLLVGVLGRILEAHVFSELLFGASPSYKEQLEREEATLPGREGFSRTVVRARNIVKALGNQNFPVDFQITVGRLSTQVAILLLPLWRLLQATDASAVYLQLMEVQLIDKVKKIVSKAGKLAVCVRRSPTIVYFDFESPGSSFVQDGEDRADDVDQEAFFGSKDETLTSPADEPSNRFSGLGKLYHIGVKISVWPSIIQYLPGNNQDGGTEGFRIYNICNSRVVYHRRLKDRRDEVVKNLSQYVELKQRNQQHKSESAMT